MLKAFRSGSTMESVMWRMCLIDMLMEEKRQDRNTSDKVDNLGWSITDTDLKHIYRATSLIIRKNGVSQEACNIPYNVH